VKSWISNVQSGWQLPPGILLRQVRFAVALACSLALHGLLLSPAFSKDHSGVLKRSADRSRIAPDDSGRQRLRVYLSSDFERLKSLPNLADELRGNGPSPPSEGPSDGKVPSSGTSPDMSDDHASPEANAPLAPLLPSTVYYRPDELDKRPEITKQIEPEFPLTVNPGTKGVVVARLFISEDGFVQQIAIVSAQPAGYFEDAVLKAFDHAQFTPGMRGGKPVRSQLTLAIDFASEVPN